LGADGASAGKDVLHSAVVPAAEAVDGAEGEIGRCLALAADGFAAEPDVVGHPGGQGEVIRVPLDLADVEGQRGDEVDEIAFRDLDEEVGIVVLAPELAFDEMGFERGAQRGEGIHDEVMDAEMGTVPILGMGEEDGAGFFVAEDGGDRGDLQGPRRGIAVAGPGGDLFQSVGAEGEQVEPEIPAGPAEFLEPGGLAFAFAAERHGDVADAPTAFAHQAQGQSPDDAFVVRVGRKDEETGGVRGGGDEDGEREPAELPSAALAEATGVFADERDIRIHGGLLMPGSGP